jgi:hypothetical protein
MRNCNNKKYYFQGHVIHPGHGNKTKYHNILGANMYVDPSIEIGFASEAKVATAFETLKIEPEKWGLTSAILKYIWAKRHSALDRKHTDFVVTLEDGPELSFQVKSSERRKKRFESFCRRLGLSIFCIVVERDEAVESVIRKIVETIKGAVNTLQRGVNKILHLDRLRREKKERKLERKLRRQRQNQFYRVHAPQMCH